MQWGFRGGGDGGGGRGLLQTPFEIKLFHFHGDFSEKVGKINK